MIDLAEDRHPRQCLAPIEEFELVAEDADAAMGRLGLADGGDGFRPHGRVGIVAPRRADHVGNVERPADHVAELRRAAAPIVALADLVGQHGAPQRVGRGIERPAPGEPARGQAEMTLGIIEAFEQGLADHATEIQQQDVACHDRPYPR